MKTCRAVESMEPLPQQSQPLQRVQSIHCALERQMRIEPLEHHDGLIDNACLLASAQPFSACKELSNADRRLEERTDGGERPFLRYGGYGDPRECAPRAFAGHALGLTNSLPESPGY